jgi:hypothetical protein
VQTERNAIRVVLTGQDWTGRTYQSRKMIDSDNGHPGVTLTDINLNGGLGEGGVDGRVDRDRVVGVGGAAATFV